MNENIVYLGIGCFVIALLLALASTGWWLAALCPVELGTLALAFSPDGAMLASGIVQGTLQP